MTSDHLSTTFAALSDPTRRAILARGRSSTMIYDISFLWIWLLLSIVLGGAIGWRTESADPPAPLFRGWLRIALIVFVVALVAAIVHVLGGRAAFWLESAVLFFPAYLIGCLAGGALKRLRVATI